MTPSEFVIDNSSPKKGRGQKAEGAGVRAGLKPALTARTSKI
ncbi:hypothetical protein [Fischerella thermalis]